MISVIIPVYNTAQYLAKCLSSVRAQTYRDWECIVVNDCSTDESEKELLGIEASWRLPNKLTIIHKDHNEGLSAARNTAMQIASGDSFMFVDSDDWIDKYALTILSANAETHPEVGRVIGLDVVHYLKRGWNLPWSITPAGIHGADSPHLFSGPDCDPGHATGCLYLRKNMPEELTFPKVKLFEDMIFNMGLMFYGASTFITQNYIYHYVRRDDSLLSLDMSEAEADETRRALDVLADRYKPNPATYRRCKAFLENALSGKLNSK